MDLDPSDVEKRLLSVEAMVVRWLGDDLHRGPLACVAAPPVGALT